MCQNGTKPCNGDYGAQLGARYSDYGALGSLRKWTWFRLCIHAAHLVLFREFLNIAGLPKFVPMVEKQNGRRPQSPFKIYGTAALPHMIYAQNTLDISQPVPMQLTDSLLHILQ